jgi:transcriptional regulator
MLNSVIEGFLMDKSIEETVILRIKKHLMNHSRADISTIAKAIDSNWATVRNKLQILEKLGDVTVEEKEGHKYYSWVGGCSTEETGNILFGLPVDHEDAELMSWIYSQIKKVCETKFKRIPSKTISQKIAVEVIRENQLRIPVGWYLYGMITPIMPKDSANNASIPSDYKQKEGDIQKSISSWAQVYGDLSPYEAELRQYQTYKNQLYQIKYDLTHSFFENKYTTPKFKENLFRFAMNVSSTDDRLQKLVNAFVESTIVLIDKQANGQSKTEINERLMDSFKEVWRCVALNGFYNDLLSGGYFNKGVLDACLESRKTQYLDDAGQNLFMLNELLPLGTEGDPLRRYIGISKRQKLGKTREDLFEAF